VHKRISALSGCGSTSRMTGFPSSRNSLFNLCGVRDVVLSNNFSIAWVNYVCNNITGGRLSGDPKWVNSAHNPIGYAYICLATNCG
jgi:hypothetical protein